jgi:hypothetical protein
MLLTMFFLNFDEEPEKLHNIRKMWDSYLCFDNLQQIYDKS